MIVRVLHEGQYTLRPETLGSVRRLDDELMQALTDQDEALFDEVRDRLVALVRAEGEPLPEGELRESDLVLPHADITMEEAQQLFAHGDR